MTSRRGFTLVETIVVMTIFAILAGGLIGSLVSGMQLWGRARAGAAGWETALALERMALELRQAAQVPSMVFEGSSDRLSFPCVLEDSAVRVTYQFDAATGELLRDVASLQALSAHPDAPPAYTTVATLETLVIQYLIFNQDEQQYQWRDAWKPEEGVFLGVRWQGLAAGQPFSKTVFVPVVWFR